MKHAKRTVFLLLAFVLLFTATSYASVASVRSAQTKPSLTFNRSVAICAMEVRKYGQPINLTLELYDSRGLVKSWSQSSTSSVTLLKNYICIKGERYYLRAHGTIGTASFDMTTPLKTCP